MKMTVFVLFALLSGCAATPQVVTTPITTTPKVVYKIPAENVISDRNSGIAFNLGSPIWNDGSFNKINGAEISRYNSDSLGLKFSNALITQRGDRIGSYKEYSFNILTTTTDGITSVELIPVSESVQPDTGVFKMNPLPKEGLDDALKLLSSKGDLSFVFEVNSNYNSEAIFANFKRLMKEQSFMSRPVKIMGNQFKSAYILEVDNRDIATCYVSIYPYRSGSKAVVIAKIHPASDSEYRVDARKPIAEVKKLIENVVNN